MRFLVRQSSAPSGSRNASLDSGCVPVPGEGLKDGNRPPREGQADPRRRRRADDLRAARGLLGELGYTVATEAAGIEEALEATKHADFDLGILNADLNGQAPLCRLPKPSIPAALRPFHMDGPKQMLQSALG
jgi:hypothetical protein